MIPICSKVSSIILWLLLIVVLLYGCRNKTEPTTGKGQPGLLVSMPVHQNRADLKLKRQPRQWVFNESDLMKQYPPPRYIHFNGTVEFIEQAGKKERRAIPVGIRSRRILRWIIGIRLEAEVELVIKHKANDIVNFLVHSPTLVVAKAGKDYTTAPGKRFRFILARRQDGSGFSHLETRTLPD